jgi:hypothetical protein
MKIMNLLSGDNNFLMNYAGLEKLFNEVILKEFYWKSFYKLNSTFNANPEVDRP